MNQYSSKLFLLRGLGGRNHLKTMSPKEVLYAHKVNRVIMFNLLHTACFFLQCNRPMVSRRGKYIFILTLFQFIIFTSFYWRLYLHELVLKCTR